MSKHTGKMKLVTVLVILLHILQLTDSKKKKERKEKKHLKFSDCGSDPDRPIRIVEVAVTPLPIRSPGRIHVSVTLNVTNDLPQSLSMDVAMSKYFFGMPFKIPCYKNIGTCHYKDVCGFLRRFQGRRCPHPLAKRQLPCTCPFHQGAYSLRRLRIRIPRMGGVLAMLAKGEYESTVRLYNEESREELGCLTVSFSMRKRRRRRDSTWFFTS